MRRILTIAKYDTKIMLKVKEALFWNMAFPIILMLLFAAIFSGGGSITIDIGILDQDNTELSQAIVDIFNSTNVTKVVILDSNETLYNMLKKRDLNAYIIIPEGFGANITSGRQATIDVYIDNTDPNTADITRGIIQGVIDRFNEMSREIIEGFLLRTGRVNQSMIGFMRTYAETINLDIEPVVGTENIQYKEFLLTGIIAYGFLFSSMVSATASIVNEKKAGTIKRLILTPVRPIEILLGKTFGALLLTLIYTALVFAVGLPTLQPKIYLNIPDLLIVVVLGSLCGISIGLIISALSKTPEGASGFAIVLGIFLQWFIGIWFPLELLPDYLRILTDYIPMKRALDVIRGILLYGESIALYLNEIMYLSIFIIIVYAVGAAILSKSLSTIEK